MIRDFKLRLRCNGGRPVTLLAQQTSYREATGQFECTLAFSDGPKRIAVNEKDVAGLEPIDTYVSMREMISHNDQRRERLPRELLSEEPPAQSDGLVVGSTYTVRLRSNGEQHRMTVQGIRGSRQSPIYELAGDGLHLALSPLAFEVIG